MFITEKINKYLKKEKKKIVAVGAHSIVLSRHAYLTGHVLSAPA